MSPYQLQHDFRVYEGLLYSCYFPIWYPWSGVVLDKSERKDLCMLTSADLDLNL